jgi:hypothetical protein
MDWLSMIVPRYWIKKGAGATGDPFGLFWFNSAAGFVRRINIAA